MKKYQFTNKLIFSILFLSLFFISLKQVHAECVQGNCERGYGVFIFEDGRVYEGQWKNELFDGMGKLYFSSGSKYTGEFRAGFMQGYGQITLLDSSKHKCTFKNDKIEDNDSIRNLWEKEISIQVTKHIFYSQIGDIYREYKNYAKSLEYYDKSLKVNPNYEEAIINKNNLKKKIAEQESKLQKVKKITFQGTPGVVAGSHSKEWIEKERSISESVNTNKNDLSTFRKHKTPAYNKTTDYKKTDDEPQDPAVEVVSHKKKLIENGGDIWKYSWKVVLRNNTDKYKKVYIEFKLLNNQDFVVSWTNKNVTVLPNQTQTFSDTRLIDKNIWQKARKTSVEIKVRP